MVAVCALVALGLIAAPRGAEAVPFTGSVDYVGVHALGNTGGPVIPGTFVGNDLVYLLANMVLLATGDIGTLVCGGPCVGVTLSHASPIQYTPALNPPIPGPPLWSHASGVSFELEKMTAAINPLTLILSGNGMFRCSGACSGYDDTPGFWVMTLNVASGQVMGSFSSSAAVPEPAVLAMLGLGLFGAARAFRSRQRAS
jgi:hypothetical protein